jgi:transcriptional regulator with XRE-family HTH domain
MALDSIVYRNISEGYASDVARIGDNLKRLRLLADLTQAELAAAAGLKQGDISKWEKNKAAPTAGNLLRLAVGLGLPVDMLLKTINPDYDQARARAVPAQSAQPEKSGVQVDLHTLGGSPHAGSDREHPANHLPESARRHLTQIEMLHALYQAATTVKDVADAIAGGSDLPAQNTRPHGHSGVRNVRAKRTRKARP